MASIFNSLNIGYTGLASAQANIAITSHNIVNAESEGYTRQRVVTAAATPLTTAAGQVGDGVNIEEITRIFDSFVFDRYTDISSDKEYADFTEKTLSELSTYFPEIDGVGIKADLAEYYNMWQTFADNPDNESIKLALAQQTENLTNNINATQEKIKGLQDQVNDQLEVNIDEVNSLAKELADLNKAIEIAEAGGGAANDLRDRRGVIEVSLSKLIGSEVSVGQIYSDIGLDSSANMTGGSYTLSVNGFNIVDGSSYHPIHLESTGATGYYEISYERQDGTLIPMSEDITGGRVGAILDLRGSDLDDTTSGVPTNGVLQEVVAQMDAFAAELITATNNLYAQSPTDKMTSNYLDVDPNNALMNTSLDLNQGSFDIVIYDIDGNITATREIFIDQGTTMTGLPGSNSIQAQIEANKDDNEDGSGINDIDDFLQFNWADYASGDSAMELFMNPKESSLGYTFAISDNLTSDDYSSGTNFAGALGLNRYLDGTNAQDIRLNNDLKTNPGNISAGMSPSAGDNSLALSMVQQQFEKYEFEVGDSSSYNTTMYGMFDVIATEVGINTNAAILANESITAQYNAIELEYHSVSKVNLDEELANLIKYQTAYGAASKIITTIDQMMQTLLGIKQ
jgi:flagellar hook-associated protein 1 FlgK